MANDPRTRRKAAAAHLPLTLADCKAQLRITYTDAAQDALIEGCLGAAVVELEDLLQRTLVETTWVATFDNFPGAVYTVGLLPARLAATGYSVGRLGRAGLKLRMCPIISVSSIKYLDVNGVQQTLAPSDYQVDRISEPGLVYPAPGSAWPATQVGALNAVEVEYKAGYLASPPNQEAAAAAVPANLRAWLKLRVGTLFANRDQVTFGAMPAEVPTLDALINTFRIREV